MTDEQNTDETEGHSLRTGLKYDENGAPGGDPAAMPSEVEGHRLNTGLKLDENGAPGGDPREMPQTKSD